MAAAVDPRERIRFFGELNAIRVASERESDPLSLAIASWVTHFLEEAREARHAAYPMALEATYIPPLKLLLKDPLFPGQEIQVDGAAFFGSNDTLYGGHSLSCWFQQASRLEKFFAPGDAMRIRLFSVQEHEPARLSARFLKKREALRLSPAADGYYNNPAHSTLFPELPRREDLERLRFELGQARAEERQAAREAQLAARAAALFHRIVAPQRNVLMQRVAAFGELPRIAGETLERRTEAVEGQLELLQEEVGQLNVENQQLVQGAGELEAAGHRERQGLNSLAGETQHLQASVERSEKERNSAIGSALLNIVASMAITIIVQEVAPGTVVKIVLP